jgi:hypothetical protein
MATTLLDSLPDPQRTAFEFFESQGYALTASRTYAEGLVLVVADDDGAEVEIDELGCLASNVDLFAQLAAEDTR